MNAVNQSHDAKLLQVLEQLETRLQRIERRMDMSTPDSPAVDALVESEEPYEEREGLEYRIGRIWLPRLGVIVLTLGVIFLLTLPLEVLPHVVANTLGFVLTGVVLAFSRLWWKSLPEFSRYLQGGAMLLLYFSTMRLHFFSAETAVGSMSIEFGLLLVVVALNLFISLKSASVYLTGMSLAMGYLTALTSTNAYVLMSGILLISVVTVIIALNRNWPGLLPAGITFMVFAHFLWSINNPLFSSSAEILTTPFANLLYLVAGIMLFGIVNLRLTLVHGENNTVIVTSFFNTTVPYILLMFLTLTGFKEQFTGMQFLTAVVYLGLAVATWRRTAGRYTTFFYTMAGNLALSAAIFNQFAIPNNFLWLCLQSFLVISLAIWFRSRIIVVTNFAIFLSIFIAYLVLTDAVNAVGLVFGFVAMLSARIMNWQRDRLELKADMLRNSYLLTTLFIFPYTLYHMLPGGWVSLSWVAVAALYYLLSKVLSNFKYRWMALATLLFAVVHLMIVGTTSFEPAYRIISFIVLGIVLLGVSLWYIKSSGKTSGQQQEDHSPADPPAAVS